MKFRPCIDIHNGAVKQIVGSTLTDSTAKDNFVSALGADYYAKLYKKLGFDGGHIIILNPVGSEYYKADLEQAEAALSAFPNGMQLGGGVNDKNAAEFIEMGASHVIVTSFVFHDGILDLERLKQLVKAVGKERLVLDLSCKRVSESYFIVTDRWQKLTEVKLCAETMGLLGEYCDEFLVHAADAEGKTHGIERGVVEILADSLLRNPFLPSCTYAGGISSMADIELLREIGGGRIDYTIGSALDIFGGNIALESLR